MPLVVLVLVVALRAALFLVCCRHLPAVLLDDHGLPVPASTPTTTTTTTSAVDWRLTLARTLFSWTFTECVLLFVLLVFQAADILAAHTRLVHFQFSLYALLLLLLVLIPQSTALVLLATTTTTTTTTTTPITLLRSPRTLLSSLFPALFSLLLLSRIPLSEPQTHKDFLTRTLSRLVVLGITILGLLSGFGAVTRAWEFLPSTHKDVVPTEEQVRAAETSLQSVRNDLERRRLHRNAAAAAAAPSSPGENGNGNWLSRMGDTLRGGDPLSLEIRGLEALEHSMSLNIASLRSKRASASFARTFRGRVWALVGRLFAGYCIVRVITATYNLLFLRSQPRSGQMTTYPDIVTNILIWLFVPSAPTDSEPKQQPSRTLTLTPESISSLTHQLSLLLVGLIVLSSIHVVMRGVSRALKITSRKLGTSLILLFLAYLMGIYLLSTLVQLRSSFPPLPMASVADASTASTTANLFTLIPAYELFNSLFDSSFLLSAVLTAVVRWTVDKLSMVD